MRVKVVKLDPSTAFLISVFKTLGDLAYFLASLLALGIFLIPNRVVRQWTLWDYFIRCTTCGVCVVIIVFGHTRKPQEVGKLVKREAE